MSEPISAYGKLPISKEYLRHNCHEGVALEVRNWMDQGYDAAGTRGHVPRSGRPGRFLYVRRNGALVIGLSMPSKDASGTREFPFAFFEVAPLPAAPHDRIFSALEMAWEALGGHFDQLVETDETDAFFALIRELESVGVPEPQNDWSTFLSRSARSWIERLYRYDPVDLWVRALWRLRINGEHLRLNSPSPELNAIRVPVNLDEPVGPQLDLWRILLRRIHSAYDDLPSAFVPREGRGAKAAWFVYRQPAPEDFGAFVGGTMDQKRFTDVVDNERRLPVEGFGAFRERLERGPLGANASLSTVLDFDLI